MYSITPRQIWRELYLNAKFGLKCIKGGYNPSFNSLLFVHIYAARSDLGIFPSSLDWDQ